MKASDGFVLLRSLLTMALILICVAAFFAILAAAMRQSGHLGTRLNEEIILRSEKTMERIR